MLKRVPKAAARGEAIHDYVVEDHVDSVLHTIPTQHEAIAWR
jgi:hypothetical protein